MKVVGVGQIDGRTKGGYLYLQKNRRVGSRWPIISKIVYICAEYWSKLNGRLGQSAGFDGKSSRPDARVRRGDEYLAHQGG